MADQAPIATVEHAISVLRSAHNCDGWAPRCKHCDRQDDAERFIKAALAPSPVPSLAPVAGDRLLASLACHIDHDEPPGLSASSTARELLQLLDGIANDAGHAALFEIRAAIKMLAGRHGRAVL